MSEKSWNKFFVEMARHVASKSKDRSTKVGAVIVGNANNVLSIGFNGFPRGVHDDVDERHERPAKYLYTEHAERNAIFNAARHGIKLEGSRLYLNCGGWPCSRCARAIIQAGITAVYAVSATFEGKGGQWEEDLEVAREMLEEADVAIVTLDEDFNIVP